jgi:hypothetical protein
MYTYLSDVISEVRGRHASGIQYEEWEGWVTVLQNNLW